MNEPTEDPLQKALQKLPKDVQPTRDLWGGVAEHIAATKRRRIRFMQLAAAIVGLGIAIGVSYRELRSPEITAPASTVATKVPLAPAWFSAQITPVALGPEYQKARATLAADLFQRIQRLAPPERDKVELGLKQIDSGLRAISEALASNPDSILLQQLVLSAYQQELQFMQNVSATTNAALGSTGI